VSLVQRYRRQGRRIVGITNDLPMAGMKNLWHTNLLNRFRDVNCPMPVHYEIQRGPTTKIQRIAATVPFWVDGHVKVREGASGVGRLFAQMEKIGEMQMTSEGGRRNKRKDDWIDAFADAFNEKLYHPMRSQGPKGPFERGAEPIEVEGLDLEDFDDRRLDMPRPVIR
jgi:hypothetical protein